ncbi:MAG: hypothetical protein ACKOYJ_08040 [Planctomycetia bacterium]
MRRGRSNPFYAVLGIAGFLFTVTACLYCMSVLRGIRPADPTASPHALMALMDRHGTPILAGQIAVLALATFGAIAFDHVEGERMRRERQPRHDDASGPGAPTP